MAAARKINARVDFIARPSERYQNWGDLKQGRFRRTAGSPAATARSPEAGRALSRIKSRIKGRRQEMVSVPFALRAHVTIVRGAAVSAPVRHWPRTVWPAALGCHASWQVWK